MKPAEILAMVAALPADGDYRVTFERAREGSEVRSGALSPAERSARYRERLRVTASRDVRDGGGKGVVSSESGKRAEKREESEAYASRSEQGTEKAASRRHVTAVTERDVSADVRMVWDAWVADTGRSAVLLLAA